MILLRFTVRNHASIRDEITLDFTHPSLRTLTPKGVGWDSVTHPVAGVFGANATGKSAILDALMFAFTAIRESATSWQASKSMLRRPFLLDSASKDASSHYEIEFAYENRRYQYGFEVDAEGIRREWLRDVPSVRWRTLFSREQDSHAIAFHSSIKAKVDVTSRELVLSRALLVGKSWLHDLASHLASRFSAVLVKDSHRRSGLPNITKSLAEGSISFSDLETLLNVADIGVTRVRVDDTNVPEVVKEALGRAVREVDRAESSDQQPVRIQAANLQVSPNRNDQEFKLHPDHWDHVMGNLVFTHRGSGGVIPAFSIHDESDGTIAWLSIAAPALETLRRGGVLAVDEIDSSLHPHLLDLLLGAFADASVNVHHAQLVFTSHESYILSPLSEVRLEPEQVWFTDKTYEGVTELSNLSDFPRHSDANVARRYLTGRYGGTPRLAPHMMAELVAAGRE